MKTIEITERTRSMRNRIHNTLPVLWLSQLNRRINDVFSVNEDYYSFSWVLTDTEGAIKNFDLNSTAILMQTLNEGDSVNAVFTVSGGEQFAFDMMASLTDATKFYEEMKDCTIKMCESANHVHGHDPEYIFVNVSNISLELHKIGRRNEVFLCIIPNTAYSSERSEVLWEDVSKSVKLEFKLGDYQVSSAAAIKLLSCSGGLYFEEKEDNVQKADSPNDPLPKEYVRSEMKVYYQGEHVDTILLSKSHNRWSRDDWGSYPGVRPGSTSSVSYSLADHAKAKKLISGAMFEDRRYCLIHHAYYHANRSPHIVLERLY